MTATAPAAEFAALASPHMPRLHRLGMRLTRQHSETADLVQESLCRAWASWSRFEQDGSLGAYLARILYNTFVSRHRHTQVISTTAARGDIADHLYDTRRLEAAANPERTWHRYQLSDEVVVALDGLPSHYRDVVELVDLGGMPYRDAAAELDIPLGTVMSRLHRARRQMRAQLTEYARSFGLAAAAAA